MEFDTSGVKLLADYTGSEIEQIEVNLKNLYATKEGTQPLDREFGLNIDFVGDPLPVAKNKFAVEVVRKTAIYEPRVKVTEVTYEEDSTNGRLIPSIHLERGDAQ